MMSAMRRDELRFVLDVVAMRGELAPCSPAIF